MNFSNLQHTNMENKFIKLCNSSNLMNMENISKHFIHPNRQLKCDTFVMNKINKKTILTSVFFKTAIKNYNRL